MQYKKGDRIKHPTKNDWGIGEVIEADAENLKVFFAEIGQKNLSLKYVTPVKVEGDEAAHPVLDRLKLDPSIAGTNYRGLPQSIQYFLQQYPQGFYDENYLEEERNYKYEAHKKVHELLGHTDFNRLLQAEKYAAIKKHTLAIINKTNLIFPQEKIQLRNALKDSLVHKQFGQALFALLYGEKNIEQRFMDFAQLLEEIDAAKWTILSYFLFFAHPNEFMFIKPTVTQNAANLCGFPINYKSQLNWLTYQSVLRFSDYLFAELKSAGLNPRDMIDIQSFMWCISPNQRNG